MPPLFQRKHLTIIKLIQEGLHRIPDDQALAV
jgi:hypothetical protein